MPPDLRSYDRLAVVRVGGQNVEADAVAVILLHRLLEPERLLAVLRFHAEHVPDAAGGAEFLRAL